MTERAVEAVARAICSEGILALSGKPATWEEHADGFKSMAREAVAAAENPALGPDRLVVAGPYEREIADLKKEIKRLGEELAEWEVGEL